MTLTRDLTRVGAVLTSRLGWNFPPARLSDLDRGLKRVAEELGVSQAEVEQAVVTPPWTDRMFEALVHQLTVGETYFWREPRTLEAFRNHALPQILQKVPHGQPIRFWSAGCATGEEAYTLAILLQESLSPANLARTSILATDVNPEFLRRAKVGIYGTWSFRNAPASLQQSHFRALPGGAYEVMPHLRERIEFSQVNLANAPFPPPFSSPGYFSVIFCRNVLIYFGRNESLRMLAAFRQSLSKDGWLVVSPSEVPGTNLSEFHRVSLPGVTLFSKTPPPGAKSEPGPVFQVRTVPRVQPLPPEAAVPPPARWEVPVPAVQPKPEVNEPAEILAARAAAGQGNYQDALAAVDSAIAADRLKAEWRYLRATIALEAGDFTAAREAVRRTLYLAPDMALGYYLLANIERAEGHEAEAKRQLETTRQLLARFQDDETVPHSEGLTAGHLKALVGGVSR